MDFNEYSLNKTTQALRRHHTFCLKKKRRVYASLSHTSDLKLIGRRFQTPCPCSCWMCGHRRRHEGVTIQELKALEYIAQGFKMYYLED